jgi:phosphoribosyl 1,2-cyclic phosphodiesterase
MPVPEHPLDKPEASHFAGDGAGKPIKATGQPAVLGLGRKRSFVLQSSWAGKAREAGEKGHRNDATRLTVFSKPSIDFGEGRSMDIRCWGSRGSIPVSGAEYDKYGGDTTCMEIRTRDDQIIIVDAGTGLRRLGNQLLEEGRLVYDMIFTHAHWDHLMGFPFFKPLYVKGTEIRLQGCPFAQKFVETMISKVMSPPNFPVKHTDVQARIFYEPVCPEFIEIGTVTAKPIRLSHPNEGNGYKFTEDDRTFVFLTDNELDLCHPGGLSFDAYRSFSEGADLLIHDAEFTAGEYKGTKGWGHSVYTTALELAIQAGVRDFGLFHLNQDRTDEAVDRMVDACREAVKEQGAELNCFAVGAGMAFSL